MTKKGQNLAPVLPPPVCCSFSKYEFIILWFTCLYTTTKLRKIKCHLKIKICFYSLSDFLECFSKYELLLGGAMLCGSRRARPGPSVVRPLFSPRRRPPRRHHARFTSGLQSWYAEMEMKEAVSDETIQVDETESAMQKYKSTLPPPHPNAVPPQERVGASRYSVMTAVGSYPLNGDDLVPHRHVVW